MKIRRGFVSNSSSASFVVIWSDSEYDAHDTPSLFDILSRIFPKWQETREQYIDYILQRTQKSLVWNTFCTTFYTTMYNDATDFGPEAMQFLTELILRKWLIGAHVQYD